MDNALKKVDLLNKATSRATIKKSGASKDKDAPVRTFVRDASGKLVEVK